MDKFLENQVINHAYHCASVWHNSKQDKDAKRYFESEKKVTLMSYSNMPEFSEKFNAVLDYYMVRENFIKASNENTQPIQTETYVYSRNPARV